MRGDGDNHMRGIGCLLTGIELFPGNIQGGSDTPAGWAKGISIDQEIKNHLQKRRRPRRPASARWSSACMVPERADTWTRMVYAGANKPIAPIDDPYQMFAKLYGRVKDREASRASSTTCRTICARSAAPVSAEDRRLLDEHATFVREMEQELKAAKDQSVGHAVPELEPGVKKENDNIPQISKMQIDLMVNSFAADFARVATLQFTNSVGGRQDALARHRRRPSRTVAPAGQRRQGAGQADARSTSGTASSWPTWRSGWPRRRSRAAAAACWTTR